MLFDVVLRNASSILPTDPSASTTSPLVQDTVNIGIKDGKIAQISKTDLQGQDVFDCAGLVVLPGVIDSQVHFREPGMTHKEDLESGTRAAAMGGVTSIFEMPNTIPATTTKELFQDKLDRAKDRAWTNYAFYIGGSPDNVDQLAELEKLPGCAGIKVFMGSSTGTLLVEDDSTLEKIFRAGTRRVILHSEDEPRLRERRHIAVDSQDVRNHHVWRDVETAVKSTTRLLKLARKTGRKVHVLHITTAEELEILRDEKDIASVECLPQHLTFTAPDCYERLGSLTQQNPPIREDRHRQAIWKAIASGVVDVMGSDHAPHTLEEKARTYPESPSGMPMVQTMIPIMLNHINKGRLSLFRFVELTGEAPRRVFGCTTKGRIAIGLDADFTIVDMNRTETITNAWIESRCGWTPFDGEKVTGWPVMSLVGGKVLLKDGKLQAQGLGKPVPFVF
jgi:dihydroorotase